MGCGRYNIPQCARDRPWLQTRPKSQKARGSALLFARPIVRSFQYYWRLSRGFRLVVEACVLDDAGHVLLITPNEGQDWQLPGGTVLKGETADRALRRVLRDACGIEAVSRPTLFWIYAEAGRTPPQHTGLFIVRQWRLTAHSLPPGAAFFALDALPEGMPPETVARIRQALEGRTPADLC